MIPLLIELKAVPAIKAIIAVKLAVQNNETIDIGESLSIIKNSVETMTDQLKEMHANCDPGVFYHQHRPLLSGWKDNPSLPHGLVYEGVNDDPMEYSGGSAAQSCAVQIIDAGLGVIHHGSQARIHLRLALKQYSSISNVQCI